MIRPHLLSALLFLAHAQAAPPTVAEVEGLSAARVVDLSLFDPALAAADPALNRAAIEALGRLQTPAALPRLEAALAHADFEVRAAAAFAWGQLESAPAGPLASRVQAEVAPLVRVRMIEALGKLAATDRTVLVKAADGDADPTVREAARIALGLVARRDKGAAPDLAAHLVAWLQDPTARYGAAFALRRAEALVEPAIFEATLTCAADPDPWTRALCVRSLGRFQEKTLAACAEGSRREKASCQTERGRQRDRLDAALFAAAGDADWRVGVEAWRAAELSGRLVALEPILAALPAALQAEPTLLAGPRLHTWTAALDAALAAPATPGVQAAAQQLFEITLQSDDAGVALGRAHLRCRAAALLDRAGGDRLAACDAAAPLGLVAALVPPMLAHRKPAEQAAEIKRLYPLAKTAIMRIALLEAAAGTKARRALAPILRAGAADPDVAVFSQTATTAAELGALELAPTLRARLEPLRAAGELEVVISLVEALATLKDKAARPLLRPRLRDSNIAVAEAAAKALTALGEPSQAAPTPRTVLPVTHPDATSATVRTTKGAFIIELFAVDAPLTVQNFVTLAERGYYDGLLFHRLVGDFVVQGGDPRGDGWGGPGYVIPCEINPRPYSRGAVGMALAGKDTGGSQWFVTHSPQPHLDGRYTVFGQVTSFEVIDALTVGDRILGITIHRAAPGPER